MKEAKNLSCYKGYTTKQLHQVSDLYSIPLLSYLPKRSTEICRAQYGNAMLVSLGGAQIWPPEINENIWNSLLLFQRLLFSRELLYSHINFSPNALTVQTAKYHKESPFFHKRKLCHGRCVGAT